MSPLVLAYMLFLLGFGVYSAIGIYHLLRFGYVGDLTKPVAIVFLLFSAFIIISTFVVLLLRNFISG